MFDILILWLLATYIFGVFFGTFKSVDSNKGGYPKTFMFKVISSSMVAVLLPAIIISNYVESSS